MIKKDRHGGHEKANCWGLYEHFDMRINWVFCIDKVLSQSVENEWFTDTDVCFVCVKCFEWMVLVIDGLQYDCVDRFVNLKSHLTC